jgi:hypothetical protein
VIFMASIRAEFVVITRTHRFISRVAYQLLRRELIGVIGSIEKAHNFCGDPDRRPTSKSDRNEYLRIPCTPRTQVGGRIYRSRLSSNHDGRTGPHNSSHIATRPGNLAFPPIPERPSMRHDLFIHGAGVPTKFDDSMCLDGRWR